jgi:hypothetical protein
LPAYSVGSPDGAAGCAAAGAVAARSAAESALLLLGPLAPQARADAGRGLLNRRRSPFSAITAIGY